MIEYLGDDLTLFDVADGIPTPEVIEALQNVAKIHVTAWNDISCLDGQSGGTNHYMLCAAGTGSFLQVFGRPGWATFMKRLSETYGATHPTLAADADLAFQKLDKWMHTVPPHGHRTIRSLDLRAENLIWRKIGQGCAQQDYECVQIDHQAWLFGPPTRDVALLLCTSMQKDRMATDFELCAKAYHTALVDAGVSDYSYTQFLEDLGLSVWFPLILAGAMVDAITKTEATAAGMTGYEENYEELTNMLKNMTELQLNFQQKALIGIDTLGELPRKGLDIIKAL